MAHDRSTKSKKKLKKREKALRKGGAAGGKPTMNADPFHPDAPADLQESAAVIHPVTPEVLDDAAQKAARLADGVAHHTVDLGEIAGGTVERPRDAGVATASEASASETARSLERTGDEAGGAARDRATDAVDATGAVLPEAADAATAMAGEAVARAEQATAHAGEAAEAALSGTVDAFGRYNALLVEMVRSNVAATGELFAALVEAKSAPEAVAINADHLRRQLDTLTSQGRELAGLAQTLTLDALKPFTEAIARDR